MMQHPLALYYIVAFVRNGVTSRASGPVFPQPDLCSVVTSASVSWVQVQAYEWFEISSKVINLELLLTAAVS